MQDAGERTRTRGRDNARWRAPVRLPRAATAAREARALPKKY